jgi:hypothetical protein
VNIENRSRVKEQGIARTEQQSDQDGVITKKAILASSLLGISITDVSPPAPEHAVFVIQFLQQNWGLLKGRRAAWIGCLRNKVQKV